MSRMSRIGGVAGVGRREVISRLGSVVAVGFASGCGGGQEGSPTSSSSSGSSSTSSSAASTNAQCVVTPALTEGPYFVDERLNRSDIRTDPATGTARLGVPLDLTLALSQVGASGCGPLSGALVDMWHCDALGVYSDVSAQRTVGQAFLRGYQTSDQGGNVRFTTIYPGWYPGRAVHIHFKVRVIAGPALGNEITSQLYFDEAVTDRIHARAPYSVHGKRTQRNREDGLFRRSGSRLMLALAESGAGYAGEFHAGLKL